MSTLCAFSIFILIFFQVFLIKIIYKSQQLGSTKQMNLTLKGFHLKTPNNTYKVENTSQFVCSLTLNEILVHYSCCLSQASNIRVIETKDNKYIKLEILFMKEENGQAKYINFLEIQDRQRETHAAQKQKHNIEFDYIFEHWSKIAEIKNVAQKAIDADNQKMIEEVKRTVEQAFQKQKIIIVSKIQQINIRNQILKRELCDKIYYLRNQRNFYKSISKLDLIEYTQQISSSYNQLQNKFETQGLQFEKKINQKQNHYLSIEKKINQLMVKNNDLQAEKKRNCKKSQRTFNEIQTFLGAAEFILQKLVRINIRRNISYEETGSQLHEIQQMSIKLKEILQKLSYNLEDYFNFAGQNHQKFIEFYNENQELIISQPFFIKNSRQKSTRFLNQ